MGGGSYSVPHRARFFVMLHCELVAIALSITHGKERSRKKGNPQSQHWSNAIKREPNNVFHK